MYELYYNPFTPVNMVRPEMTVEQSLLLANQRDNNVLANLVRLNWMIQDLKCNIIYKPILLREGFEVVTGDTRMMAISMHPYIKDVPALLTVRSPVSVGNNWIKIDTKQHLAELVGTKEMNIVCFNDWNKQEVEWIEFAMPHTENHMHDEEQRMRMILNYLQKYPDTIFDQDWLLERIDWNLYDH